MIEINLIPPEQTRRVKQMTLYQNVVFSGLIIFLLFLLLIVSLGGFLIFLNFKYLSAEQNIEIEQGKTIRTETINTMEKKVKNINDELVKLGRIYDQKSDFYSIIDKLDNDVFKGIKIYNLEINGESKLITVSGFSAERQNLLMIKKIIETSPDYKNLDFPLSNLANPRNIDFRINFNYTQ